MNARNNLFHGIALHAPVQDVRSSLLRTRFAALIHRVTGMVKADPLVVFLALCNAIFYATVIFLLLRL